MNETSVEIVIGGDVCPTFRDRHLFETGDADGLFGDLCPEFSKADVSIVNLECPLCSGTQPIAKSGAAFAATPECVRGLKAAGIAAVNLANNHIMDQGEAGIEQTLDTCRNAEIITLGAGMCSEDAGKVVVFPVRGLRIAVLSFAEREFGTAMNGGAGANPIGAIRFVRLLKASRHEFDALVVLLHAGKEHYPYPSPRLQELCRFMTEQGAAAVICQHSHCQGAYELHEGGHIVYGQGNLLFDPHPDPRPWLYEGYLVCLAFSPDGSCGFRVVPHIQSGERLGARRLTGNAEQCFLEVFRERASKVRDEAFVEKCWQETCWKEHQIYFGMLRGHGRLKRFLNRRTGYAERLYTTQSLLDLHNVVRCETHREVLETILANCTRDL